jgi:hypothetical protein
MNVHRMSPTGSSSRSANAQPCFRHPRMNVRPKVRVSFLANQEIRGTIGFACLSGIAKPRFLQPRMSVHLRVRSRSGHPEHKLREPRLSVDQRVRSSFSDFETQVSSPKNECAP